MDVQTALVLVMHSWYVRVILGELIVDLATGLIAAGRTGTFKWSRLADILVGNGVKAIIVMVAQILTNVASGEQLPNTVVDVTSFTVFTGTAVHSILSNVDEITGNMWKLAAHADYVIAWLTSIVRRSDVPAPAPPPPTPPAPPSPAAIAKAQATLAAAGVQTPPTGRDPAK